MSASIAEGRVRDPATKLLAPGDVIDGRYRIEAFLGGGGMASVYRATHIVLEQPVAIKVISPQIRTLPGMGERFIREARAATQLKSEHVARVFDVGSMADGAPYMVMEFLEGQDLDATVATGKELAVEDAVDYVLQACEALAEVHGLGIVHRDLKPANLFLTRGADGLPCIKLIDFGISRTDSPLSPRDASGLTHPETVMGSPRYMSPEQMESASKAGPRSDIYGLGAVLFELLTHESPFEGDTFLDIYAAATLGEPSVPSSFRSDISRALDEVILRCLRADPAQRFADVADLAAALAPFGPEGSHARADAIARVLDAARSRTREAGLEDAEGDDDRGPSKTRSKVRRRKSSSAHALRRRRIIRGGVLALAVGVAAMVAGGRVLYTRSHAASVAADATNGPLRPVTADLHRASTPPRGSAAPATLTGARTPSKSTTATPERAIVPAAGATPSAARSAAEGSTATVAPGSHATNARPSQSSTPSMATLSAPPSPASSTAGAARPAATAPSSHLAEADVFGTPSPKAVPQRPPASATSDHAADERKLFEERK